MLPQSRCHLSEYNKSSHLSEHDKVCFNGSTDVKMIPGSVHAQARASYGPTTASRVCESCCVCLICCDLL